MARVVSPVVGQHYHSSVKEPYWVFSFSAAENFCLWFFLLFLISKALTQLKESLLKLPSFIKVSLLMSLSLLWESTFEMSPTEEVGLFYLGYFLPVSRLVQRESITPGGWGMRWWYPYWSEHSMAVPVPPVSPDSFCLRWPPLCCCDTWSVCSTEQNTLQRLFYPIKMFYYLSFLSRLCNWIPSFSIFMAAKGGGKW